MRIVGGAWRGRSLRAPKGHTTRPTSDRVREALFDALTARLGSDLGGGAVLDLFAGTGALGLEALSRGAARAIFVEQDRDALASLRSNIEALGAGARAVVVAGDALYCSRAVVGRGPFALLLADPPYKIEAADVASTIGRIDDAGGLARDALLVVEHAAKAPAAAPAGFEGLRTYTYGDTAVTLFARNA